MREDFAKLLVERPRTGAGWHRVGRPGRDVEAMPVRAGMKRGRRHGSTKNLNENLAPLRRYLEGQVGRPWSAVFSEMRARIKPGTRCRNTS